jgi:hypothetical protein
MLPIEEQDRIRELKKKYTDQEGTGKAKVFNELSDSVQQLEGVPEQMKEVAYHQMLNKVREQNPGVTIPERFSTYNQQAVRDLQLGFMARVESVGDMQKKSEQAAKDAAEMARTRETIAGHVKSAGISAAGGIKQAEIRAAVEKPQRPDVQATLDNLTLNSPTKLAAYAKKNGLDEDEARAVLKAQVDSYRQDKLMAEARKRAELRVGSSFMKGSPDQGKSATDILDEEVAKITGKQPAMSAKEYKQKYPQYKNIPDETIKAAYKAKTGQDLK